MFLKLSKLAVGNYHFSSTSFVDFAKILLQTQSISSTKRKKQVITHYYENCDVNGKKQIQKIMGFVFEKPVTNISNRNLINLLMKKYGFSNQQKTDDIEKIGEQIFTIISLNNKQNEELSKRVELQNISNCIDNLKEIEGSGSIQKKMSKIIEILDNFRDEEEVKIFLRIVMKNLRIGLTKKSINFEDQPKQTDKFEEVAKNQFNVNDLFSNTKNNLLQLKGEMMLSKPLKNLQDVFNFCQKKQQKNSNNKIFADLKYDGERTLIIYNKNKKIEMLSRRNKSQSQKYPQLMHKLQKQLISQQNLENIVLDGEIVCLNQKGQHLPMQQVLRFRGKMEGKQQCQQNIRLKIFIFDALYYNDKNLISLNFIERRKYLLKTQTLQPSLCRQFNYPKEKQELVKYFLKIVGMQYQGLILKGEHDFYNLTGSRKYWGKFKKGCKIDNTDTGEIDLDLVVMGVDKGKGKKSQILASFLLGAYHQGKLYPITKVGSGFTDQQAEDLTKLFSNFIISDPLPEMIIPRFLKAQQYVYPQVVFKVKCQDLTRSPLYNFAYRENYGGLSLRFPVYEGVRQDKLAKDCKADVILDLSKNL